MTYEQQREMEIRHEALKASGADQRHLIKKLADLRQHKNWSESFDDAARVIQNAGILVLLGDRGNGKTQMAVELIRKVCREHTIGLEYFTYGFNKPNFAKYVRGREIGMKLREAYDNNNTMSEQQAIDIFVQPHLLVIDECQERPDKDFEMRSLTLIIDKRYASCKPTVMVANCTPKQFTDIVGSSIADRIKEGGAYINFKWPSFREVK